MEVETENETDNEVGEATLQEWEFDVEEPEMKMAAAEGEELQEEESIRTGQIISISMKEMQDKMAAGESFLISFVTIDCPYCQDFHTMLVDYIQEHIVTMYQVILDYEEESEEENRKLIAEIFPEFNTVPGVFYVENGKDGSYLDTYHLGVGKDVFDEWVQELGIEEE